MIINKIQISFKNNQNQSSKNDSFANFILPTKQQNTNLSQPTVDKFSKISTNENNNKKRNAIITAGIGVLATGLAVLIAVKTKKAIKPAQIDALTTKQIKAFEEQMKLFPKDIEYRKNILEDMGLNPKEYHKLRSIIGREELVSLVKEFDNKPISYSPCPIKDYYDSDKVKFPAIKEYVENLTYRANLHLHTQYSDGNLTVSEVLNQAVEYADKVAKSNPSKSPFIIAITDHDAIKGCNDAIEIIKKDPWKYRNLRVVLGIENTTVHKNENLLNSPAHVHLLTYGINPKGKDLQEFLLSRLEENHKNQKNVIKNANNKFKDILAQNKLNYNFEELTKAIPRLGSSICDSAYYMKDYLQFRLIYAHIVENNKPLADFMEKNGINIKDLDFIKGKNYIPTPSPCNEVKKYYDYYCDALKEYILAEAKNKNPQIDEKQLTSKFINLSPEVKNVLEIIEADCPNAGSDLHVPNVEHYSFSDAVSKIASFKNGVMGMAHPGVLFPKNCIKDKKDIPELYSELYDIFMEKGKSKAMFAEDYYQVYWKNEDKKMLDELSKISSRAGLLKTGSLDTHGKSIFEE